MNDRPTASDAGGSARPHEHACDSAADLARKDKAYVWHPFTQMADYVQEEPLTVESADGVILRDVHGQEYLDGVSSLWCNLHGHRRGEIDRAIREQLDLAAHTTLLGLASPPSIRLAEQLVEISPRGLSKVFYSDDGSTAVEIALKMAFQYWRQNGRPERRRFLALDNAYHGDTLGAVSVGGIPLFHAAYEPLLFECCRAPSPYCYRCPLGLERARCGMACLKRLEGILQEHGDEIAAVVVEPLVQAAGGMIVMPEGYLRGVAEACRGAGALLIVDEVATGFGRTGKMFACDWEDVRPDIMACAKGLTGGYLPLAATLTTDAVYDGFCGEYAAKRTLFHGHTYTGNALACAAALANLRLFRDERVLDGLQPKIALLTRLVRRFRDLPHVGDVRQRGFMSGIELVRDRATREEYAYGDKMGIRVTEEARRRGLVTRPLGDVIVVMPSLAITEDLLSRMMDILFESIRAATE